MNDLKDIEEIITIRKRQERITKTWFLVLLASNVVAWSLYALAKFG